MRSKLFIGCHAGIVLFASSLTSWSSVRSRALVTAYVPSFSSSSIRYSNTAGSTWKAPAKIISSPPFLLSSVLFSSSSGVGKTDNNPLPTIDQLSSDPFIRQVSYAERVVAECLMIDNHDANGTDSINETKKLEMLKAQLSHSDGIRGFFVTYLTAMAAASAESRADNEASSAIPPADRTQVPPLLVEAMKSVADADDLIRLACMNVIMPTGMMTMHTDAQLSEQSKITATRAVRVLDGLNSIHPTAVQSHVSAIYAAARSSSPSSTSGKAETDELMAFWTTFFEKWGYQQKQRNDIAKAIQPILK